MKIESNETAEAKATAALKYIIPPLKRYNFRWCISGGFACYIYCVDRPIKTIDIDIEIVKDDPKLRSFVDEIKPYTKLPFQLWIDKNYDNWVVELIYKGQRLSICPTSDLKLFNKDSGEYELFYKNGIPDPVIVEFKNLSLPLLPKEWTLKMKEALAHKNALDRTDISGMEEIFKTKG